VTRTGSAKKVDGAYARGRLANARSYLQAARDGFAFAYDGANLNPVMSLVISAAIAYTDALTASRKSVVNQQDHSAAVKLLRDALGRDLPAAHERQLRRILADKDAVQYGASIGRYSEAEKMLADLEEFAAWAERQLLGG
jgi:hypothetical protein